MKKRIMSGMRPTGKLHLGHYLGVLKNWVNLQNEYECFFAIADWHALTTKYDKTEDLEQNVLEVATDWLACGVDPHKSIIYVQSLVPETAELNIYLSMVTPQNWVERDPTLKDMAKILRTKEGMNTQISYGLMGYPVLMSADIMTFNADFVPVGSDQIAHVEITRDIAGRFNYIYKTDFFHQPEPKLNDCALICGIDGNKMGKSYGNDIKISDSPEETTKKIMKSITDRSRIKKDDLGHPEQCEVVFKYWKLFGEDNQINELVKNCTAGKIGCADCKRMLANQLNGMLKDIREKRCYYEHHQDEVRQILKDGSQNARLEAQKILKQVRKLVKMYD